MALDTTAQCTKYCVGEGLPLCNFVGILLRYQAGRKLNFNFGQYITLFQAEVHTIKACVVENLNRDYRNDNPYIFLDSQAIKT